MSPVLSQAIQKFEDVIARVGQFMLSRLPKPLQFKQARRMPMF